MWGRSGCTEGGQVGQKDADEVPALLRQSPGDLQQMIFLQAVWLFLSLSCHTLLVRHPSAPVSPRSDFSPLCFLAISAPESHLGTGLRWHPGVGDGSILEARWGTGSWWVT